MTEQAEQSTSNPGALDRLVNREEILQICYWYQGEGLGDVYNAKIIQPFLNYDENLIEIAFNELIEDGENQEEEEFFPNIWNLFAPLIKGSDAVELPTDSESEKWFEENIGIVNNCSASSAIYKFRLWLRERK